MALSVAENRHLLVPCGPWGLACPTLDVMGGNTGSRDAI